MRWCAARRWPASWPRCTASAKGCSGGRGGSMHLFDREHGLFGGNAIVGGGLPLAVGLALADHMRGEDGVTACFFGEGAAAEGVFHESLNLAALWGLPVLFVCENNRYAMGTALELSEVRDRHPQEGRDLSHRLRGGRRHGRRRGRGGGAGARSPRCARPASPTSWSAAPIGSARIPCSTPSTIATRPRSRPGGRKGPDRPLPGLGDRERSGASGRRRAHPRRGRQRRSTQRSPPPRPGRWEPVEDLTRYVCAPERPAPPPAPAARRRRPSRPATARRCARRSATR